MRINERGYWEGVEGLRHGVDPLLAQAIVDYLGSPTPCSVYDLGCGDGYYTKFLRKNGFYVIGLDGNPETYKLTGGDCYTADLTEHLVGKPLDWSICLEVGEHIPAEYEDILLDNINNLSKDGTILSWAIEGQGGDGHINCRNNDYIIQKMVDRGLFFDRSATQYLRNHCSPYPKTGWWFKNTIMVFKGVNTWKITEL